MATLRVQIDDLATQAALDQIRARLGNLQPFYKEVGEALVRSTDQRFRDERAPDGTPWAPLAEATLKRKERLGKILKILQQDGFMRGTIIYRETAQQVEVGTIQPYAKYHQFPNKRMPDPKNRPFLGISPQDERAIARLAREYLDI